MRKGEDLGDKAGTEEALGSVELADIQDRIYTIRSVQVMLDRDLARFYEVKPIRLREQVKRNINRFPPDIMFRLTENEVELMVSQNAIPSRQHLGSEPWDILAIPWKSLLRHKHICLCLNKLFHGMARISHGSLPRCWREGIAFCDTMSSTSFSVSLNMISGGKRLMFLFTCSLNLMGLTS